MSDEPLAYEPMSNEPMSNPIMDDVPNEPPIMAPSSPYMYPTSPPWILTSSASTPNASSPLTPSHASSSSYDLNATNDNDRFLNDKCGDKFDNKSELNSDCKVQLPSSEHSSFVLRLRGGVSGVSDDTPVRRTRNKVYPSQGPAQSPSSEESPRSAFIRGIKEAHTPAKPATSASTPPTNQPTSSTRYHQPSPFRSPALPGPLSHPDIAPDHENHMKALKQLELARTGHGAYSVSWNELLLPQAWEILSIYSIHFSKDDSLNKLAALLVRSPRFTSVFGKTLVNLKKFVKFDFDIGCPWTPISTK